MLPVPEDSRPFVVGVVHASPLPGSPRFSGSVEKVIDFAERDVKALVAGGVDGLILENFGDSPFYSERVPPVTIAALSHLGTRIRQRTSLPLGLNVLRNDAVSAMSIAAVIGAEFIRVNVLCGARLTDQGIIQGNAHELLRLRRQLGATNVSIFADVDVKHSAPLATRPIEDEVIETIERGHADAVIVTGRSTGATIDFDELARVKQVSRGRPVLIGSGVTLDQIPTICKLADGLIVGTHFKFNGDVFAPVEQYRVQEFMAAIRERSKSP